MRIPLPRSLCAPVALLLPSLLFASAALGGDRDGGLSPFTNEAVSRGLVYPMMNFPPAYGYLGWGCGFVDFDNDGDPDIIIIGAADKRVGIFENTGGGFFVDRSSNSGIPTLPQGSSFAVADYNNDGILDINFTQLAAGNKLVKGLGNFKFQDVTTTAGVIDTGAGKGCAWGDFDLDGWLDLYICNYDGIVPNTAGKPDCLFRNNHDGTFTNVAVAQGCAANGYGFEAAWTDIDRDGDLDLYLSQDRGFLPPLMQGNRLWRNDNGTLVEISVGSGANVQLFSMGMGVGDIDGNGYQDFHLANVASQQGPMNGVNPLLMNQGNNTFSQDCADWGVCAYLTTWGIIFFDFDNNGWLDIYTNIMFSADHLYANDGTPPMTDVTFTANVGGLAGPNIASFSSAVGDVDGDGDLDILVNHNGANVQLLINHEGEKRDWIKYRIVGEQPNRFAIGANVDTRVGETWRYREVLSGGNSYLGANEMTVHVGLADTGVVDEAVVKWPGGKVARTLTNLPTNQTWAIYPPSRLGDHDGDGDVDAIDLGGLASIYGSQIQPGFEMFDFDGNSVIDQADAGAFLKVYRGPIEDCNGNSEVDLYEILENVALDADGDGKLDDCSPTSSGIFYEWNDALLQIIRETGGGPCPMSRKCAIVHVAMYDAVNSITRTHETYSGFVDAPSTASLDAAVAQAAHDALAVVFPRPVTVNVDALLAKHLATIPDGPDKDAGIAIGAAAAAAVLELRADDGSSNNAPFVPVGLPGFWEPSAPTYTPAHGPNWYQVAPWCIESADQFSPVGPGGFTSMTELLASQVWVDNYNEVRDWGSTNSALRTEYDTETAKFWANDRDGTYKPPGHLFYITKVIALSNNLSMEESARLFALVALAMADSGIAAWECKYAREIDLWRPMQAIWGGESDGNPATIGDPAWEPLSFGWLPAYMPNFPAWVSGHATFGATHAAILRNWFNTDNMTFTVTSDDTPGVYRTYSTFTAAAKENGRSRIFLGVHYSFDNDDGYAIGTGVGNWISDHYLRRLGDLDGDDVIGAADIAILLGSWGPTTDAADLDRNGFVDATDLSILLGNWGG